MAPAAPGANYMGGKRNAARARSKDTTRRAHKAYFGRQRLDILFNGLSTRKSKETSGAIGPRATASDIALSHAKNTEENEAPGTKAFIPRPHHPTKAHHHSSSEKRTSRILEALDTAEPLAMRASMHQILSIPDLAGLSVRPKRESKRSRPGDSDSPCPQQKRHKGAAPRSSSLSPEESIEDAKFQSMAVDSKGSNYHKEHEPSANPHLLVEEETSLARRRLPVQRHLNGPPISLSTNPSYGSVLTPLSQQDTAGFRLLDNLYDYQDPWNAVGVILGLEEEYKESFAGSIPQTEEYDLDDDAASVFSSASNESLESFAKRLAPEPTHPSSPCARLRTEASVDVDDSARIQRRNPILMNEANPSSLSMPAAHQELGPSVDVDDYAQIHSERDPRPSLLSSALLSSALASPASRVRMEPRISDSHASDDHPEDSLGCRSVENPIRTKFIINNSKSASSLLRTKDTHLRSPLRQIDVRNSPDPHTADVPPVSSRSHIDSTSTATTATRISGGEPLTLRLNLFPKLTASNQSPLRRGTLFNLDKGAHSSTPRSRTPPAFTFDKAKISPPLSPNRRASPPAERPLPRFTNFTSPLEHRKPNTTSMATASVKPPSTSTPPQHPSKPRLSPRSSSSLGRSTHLNQAKSEDTDHVAHGKTKRHEVTAMDIALAGEAVEDDSIGAVSDNKFFGDLHLFSDDEQEVDSDD